MLTKNRLYTIYDRVAEEMGPVMMAPNDGVAMRGYRAALQQVCPSDSDAYWLYYIGDVDTATMVITPVGPSRIEIMDRQLMLGGE